MLPSSCPVSSPGCAGSGWSSGSGGAGRWAFEASTRTATPRVVPSSLYVALAHARNAPGWRRGHGTGVVTVWLNGTRCGTVDGRTAHGAEPGLRGSTTICGRCSTAVSRVISGLKITRPLESNSVGSPDGPRPAGPAGATMKYARVPGGRRGLLIGRTTWPPQWTDATLSETTP